MNGMPQTLAGEGEEGYELEDWMYPRRWNRT